jgi:hypothetical protein
MKKLAYIASMLLACQAFATWPIGNIGLDVDRPMGILDANGVVVIRGKILIPHSDADAECIQGDFDNIDMSRNGIYFGISSCDGGPSITLEDGEGDDYFVFRGGIPIIENWGGAIRLRNTEHNNQDTIIGHRTYVFSNCTDESVVNYVRDFDQCNSVLIQLNGADRYTGEGTPDYSDAAFGGCTLCFGDSNGYSPSIDSGAGPIRITIQTSNFGEYEAALKIAVNHTHSTTEWFSIEGISNCIILELMYFPPAYKGDPGRFQYISGIDGYDLTPLEPDFGNWEHGGRMPASRDGF